VQQQQQQQQEQQAAGGGDAGGGGGAGVEMGVEEGEQMSEEGADSFNTLFGEGQEEEQADGEDGLIGEEEERGEQPGGGIRVPDHPRGGRGVYEKDGEEGQAVPADADPYLAGGAVLEVRMLPALQL
jgi:hypothetical protein